MLLKYAGPGRLRRSAAFLSASHVPCAPFKSAKGNAKSARAALTQSGLSSRSRSGGLLGGTGAGSTSASSANPGCAWWSKILIRAICGSRR